MTLVNSYTINKVMTRARALFLMLLKIKLFFKWKRRDQRGHTKVMSRHRLVLDRKESNTRYLR